MKALMMNEKAIVEKDGGERRGFEIRPDEIIKAVAPISLGRLGLVIRQLKMAGPGQWTWLFGEFLTDGGS
jgi:hypothetical protein